MDRKKKDCGKCVETALEFGRMWTVDEFHEWMRRVETKGVRNGLLFP